MAILTTELGSGIHVFERGWLSSNNVLLRGRHGNALVDSGYALHAPQTLALIRDALGAQRLDVLLNTHLHSDHCGGNSALQQSYPGVRTYVPSGLAEHVLNWDPDALSYVPTGQWCPAFGLSGVLRSGDELALGDSVWQIHAAPGHDPHSIVLFESRSRILISADALWENGFGVVFPELEGDRGFAEVAGTLERIESLDPLAVIPGHGSVFAGPGAVKTAIERARTRLNGFVRNPSKHATHAMKVLLKFHMLEVQCASIQQLQDWAAKTPYFRLVASRYFARGSARDWVTELVEDLCRSGALEVEREFVYNR